ncbi:saccharopine dehydrogenase NADP-binding domain-containing protein [Streptantibioticus ferralitis]|uniref:Saccharopine dehydrogenase NADP-binding domain-containing protein n=1 Tax=Streptantibioticus ferralitis TaxID=236510 RepID=A0ABT5Z0V0_9ACTN|nr:saccharopine dehydrogenase NADP-binding domain-containing protein [Streptantibioticus ferralitis]MDF2257470.1 saccharopine dehydrogenase NADP-binding domain-containing protein [Streptantibioticus ferralitis]
MIGIIGGYGAVGAQAARLLGEWGAGPLRIGGRNLTAAQRAAAALPGTVEAAVVDVDDDASLAAFVQGCEVVVGCAGPSHRTAARVARAALAAGAHYVEAGGDTVPEYVGERRAVFAAGALPGLSGLLPRWLAAREFTTVHALTCYAGVLDRFTPTGAEDYLRGVLGGDNEPLAAWRDGDRRSSALTRQAAVTLPFFPREVSAVPYLDAEGEQLARDLSLTHGHWYTVLDGEHLGAALDAARTRPPAEAAADLCRATALDAAGRTPYVTLLIQLDGTTAAGRAATRTAVLRAPGIAELTGAMTAATALAVLRGEVPAGARHAATALDPSATVGRLRDRCELTVLETTIDQLVVVEEGAL